MEDIGSHATYCTIAIKTERDLNGRHRGDLNWRSVRCEKFYRYLGSRLVVLAALRYVYFPARQKYEVQDAPFLPDAVETQSAAEQALDAVVE